MKNINQFESLKNVAILDTFQLSAIKGGNEKTPGGGDPGDPVDGGPSDPIVTDKGR